MLNPGDPLVEALLRGDLDAANARLAADPLFRGRLAVERVDNARVATAAPIWRIEADGSSIFRFHPDAWGPLATMIFDRWRSMLPLVAATLDVRPPPGRVSFNLGDTGHRPGLAFCDNRPGFTLIPDPIFCATNNYADVAARFEERALPYAERQATLFWRGTTTGPEGADIRTLPRLRLCRIGREMGAAADIGLSDLTAPFQPAEANVRAEGLMRDYVPIHDLDRYRLHVDIDGHSNSWPGLMTKLLSGTPVLKVASESHFRQWYYDRLEPGTHYVAIRADMSDLADTATTLLADPKRAEAIGAAGHAFAQTMTLQGEIARALPAILAAFEPLVR